MMVLTRLYVSTTGEEASATDFGIGEPASTWKYRLELFEGIDRFFERNGDPTSSLLLRHFTVTSGVDTVLKVSRSWWWLHRFTS